MKSLLKGILALSLCFGITISSIAEDMELAVSDTNFANTYSNRLMEKELQCLAKNIYFEAGSEPLEGKVAVAQVSINRAESGKFPDTLCDVVHQKTKVSTKYVCQFSWVCEGRKIVDTFSNRWNEAMAVARMVLIEGYRIPKLENALYFHNTQVSPNWGKSRVARIGNHIFYRDPATKRNRG